MSALRISRPGQPTTFVLQEPAVARVQGHGGAAMGTWGGTVLTAHQKRDNERKLARGGRPPRGIQRCGVPTRFGDPCGRTPGHKPPHKGPEAVARIAARMRGAA